MLWHNRLNYAISTMMFRISNNVHTYPLKNQKIILSKNIYVACFISKLVVRASTFT